MSLKTLSKRLATVEDSAAHKTVDRLIDALINALGDGEARRFWDAWHSGERTPAEDSFVLETLQRPEVKTLAGNYCLMGYIAEIRK